MFIDGIVFLEGTWQLLLKFAQVAIPPLIVLWFIDRLVQHLPWVASYREWIKQTVLNRIDAIKLERTKTVVLVVERMYRSSLAELQMNAETLSGEQLQRFKDHRNRTVLEAVSDRRITQNVREARLLIEQAVHDLKLTGEYVEVVIG
jgi:hypothetical protein